MFEKARQFLLANRSVRQTVAKNTFWIGLSSAGSRIVRAVIVIYAARLLGAAEWGAFSYAVSLVAFLTIFTDFGIGPYLTRETVHTTDPETRARVLSASFYTKLAMALAGGLLTAFIAPFFTPIEAARTLLPLAALILIFDTIREFGGSVSRSMERMEWEAALQVGTNIFILIFGFALIARAPDARHLMYAYVLGTGLGTAATFLILREHLRGIFTRFSRSLVRPLLAASWPFAVAGLLGSFMIHSDILLISFFRSAEEVGFYSAGVRIIQLVYLIPVVLAVSSFPVFARLSSRPEAIRPLIEKLLGLALLFAMPLAVGGVLIGEDLMQFIFGEAYLPGAPAFRVLMLTFLVNFPAVLLANTLFAVGRERALIGFAALGGIGNILLDLILIPHYGIAGAAWATVIVQAASVIYLRRAMAPSLSFSLSGRLARAFSAAVLAGFAAAALRGVLPVPLVLLIS
ncbi:MAG: flippase, partial [Candidatus Liptonbacteria bacterium]|nr:flippase [Candidatus Liptonbacteria bacterium]